MDTPCRSNPSRVLLHIVCDMGVNVQCGGAGNMADDGRQRLHIHPMFQCIGGENVSEVVESDLFAACVFQYLGQSMTAKAEGYYEIFLLELTTGLRVGELMALQWDDLNFNTGELAPKGILYLILERAAGSQELFNNSSFSTHSALVFASTFFVLGRPLSSYLSTTLVSHPLP